MCDVILDSAHKHGNRTPKSPDFHWLRTSSAFTLMEILVVTSIIALLLSLTLSVVQTVRASAHGVSCLSNLRQMNIGVFIYANEHDGYLPVPSFSNWDRSRWPLMVAANYLITDRKAYGSTNAVRNVLVCPADTRADAPEGTPNAGGLHQKMGLYADSSLSEKIQWIRASYCFNDYAFSNGYYPSPPDIEGHAIPALLEKMSMTKAMYWDSWYYDSAPTVGSIYGLNLHRSGINMSFPDGTARFYDFAPSQHGEAWSWVNWPGSNAVYTWWGPNEPKRLIGPNAGAKWLNSLAGEPWD